MTSNDNELRTAVECELAAEPTIESAAIGVSARHGIVKLTGTVECWADKHAAELAAYRVAYVHDVANEIAIKPSWSTARTDAEIAETVRSGLDREIAQPRSIRVVVADCGSVTLAGEVVSLADRDTAARIVGDVDGVRFVTNELLIAGPTTTASEVRSAIRLVHPQHGITKADHIEVVIEGDTVVLTGSVGSWLERRAVLAAVRGAARVKQVDDRITVKVEPNAMHRTGYDR
jgi:osmotically-inducible protein OsmY